MSAQTEISQELNRATQAPDGAAKLAWVLSILTPVVEAYAHGDNAQGDRLLADIQARYLPGKKNLTEEQIDRLARLLVGTLQAPLREGGAPRRVAPPGRPEGKSGGTK